MSGRAPAADAPPDRRDPLSPDLPLRPNVGIVLMNGAGLVFTGRCFPNPHGWPDPEISVDGADWCMPQGGVDPGEDIVAAARRELDEETGIRAAEHVATMAEPIAYDFPVRGAAGHKLHPFRGQVQRWTLFRFLGSDDDVRIDAAHTHEPAEFLEWRWRPVTDLMTVGILHRRPVYDTVARWLAGRTG